MPAPRYLALCGKPGAGKSTVQEILARRYGVKPIDDGRPLRDACKSLFGLTEDQVTTMAGKKEFVLVCGQEVQVRDLLGWIGQVMEDRFGDQFTAEAAVRYAERVNLGNHSAFSFGSVRKTQGKTYREHGGLVIEVDNPRVPESQYAFDRFDRSLVNVTIRNDGSIGKLESDVAYIFDQVFGGS